MLGMLSKDGKWRAEKMGEAVDGGAEDGCMAELPLTPGGLTLYIFQTMDDRPSKVGYV